MSTAVLGIGGTIAAGSSILGAGASIYGASQSGGGSSAMPMLSPKKSLLSYIKGLDAGLPAVYDLEQQYRSKFGGLNAADQTDYLTTLLGLSDTATSAAGDQIQEARQRDLADMLGNSGSVLGILRGINPAGARAMDQSATMADDAYTRSQGLTPQERRAADQQSREAFAARGRLNDNIGVASEILGREDVLARKREEAFSALGQSFQTSQSFTSPALNLLTGVPAATSLGQDLVGQSAGIIGKNLPQFINPDAGINMGLQQNANLASYQQAQAARQAGNAQMWGQVGSSLLGLSADLFKNYGKTT